jgi:hypothetical protein
VVPGAFFKGIILKKIEFLQDENPISTIARRQHLCTVFFLRALLLKNHVCSMGSSVLVRMLLLRAVHHRDRSLILISLILNFFLDVCIYDVLDILLMQRTNLIGVLTILIFSLYQKRNQVKQFKKLRRTDLVPCKLLFSLF